MSISQKTYYSVTTNQQRRIKRGYVETPKPKEYVRNLSYYKIDLVASGEVYPGNGAPIQIAYETQHWTHIDQTVASATEIAKSVFRSSVDGSASGNTALGISVVQWKQSLDMLSNRTNTLLNFARKVPGLSLAIATGTMYRRRRALNALARSLKIPSNSKDLRRLHNRSDHEWRQRIKTPGDLFLEFWFGWSPLVKDMFGACDILQQPIDTKPRKVRGGGTLEHRKEYGSNVSSLNFNHCLVVAKVHVGIYALVKVTNPNLYLANRLGLINPASVALDAIPFSWLLNWIVNIQQYANSLTFDAGTEILSGSVGRGVSVSYRAVRRVLNISTAYKLSKGSSTGYRKNRDIYTLGFTPKLRVEKPHGSLTRALTALALLSQHLAKF